MGFQSDLATVSRHAAHVEKFSEGDTTQKEIVTAYKKASPEMKKSMAETARRGLARHADTDADRDADRYNAAIAAPAAMADGDLEAGIDQILADAKTKIMDLFANGNG